MHPLTVFSNHLLKDKAGPNPALHYLGKVLVGDSLPVEIKIVSVSSEWIIGLVPISLAVGENCMIAFDATFDGRIRRINMWGAIDYCCVQNGAYRVEISNSDCDSMSRHYLDMLAA